MKRTFGRIVLLAAILPALATARAEESTGVQRVYQVYNVDAGDAILRVQARCPDCLTSVIQMAPDGRDRDFIRVFAPLPEQEKIARLIADVDVAPPKVRFQVIFLDAFDKSLPPPELPAIARPALDDVRTLFPFKGYAVRHIAQLNTGVRAFARVGNDYDLAMSAEPREAKSFYVRNFLVRRAGSDSAVLANDFPIRLGETVVLGTSQALPAAPAADAPRALIVLVTAVP